MKFNGLEKVKKVLRKTVKIVAIGITASIPANAQTNKINDLKDLNPTWNLDMSKYPGMHPSKVFEIEGYNKLDVDGKIKWTKDAIRSEEKNLEIDTEMGELEEQLKKVREEIKRLKQQLLDLEKQNQPSV